MTHHSHGLFHLHLHPDKSRQGRMLWAIGITGSVLLVEAVGGILSGSLALISDAGHMVTDLASLLISLAAMVMAGRPASETHTYGYARLEVLAALGNAFTFFLMVIGVGWQAVQRFAHPALPDWKTMGFIASIGLAANVLSAWFLHGAEKKDLNIRSAWIHVMGDMVSSVGVLAGVLVIAKTGWTWVDPLLSLGIALLIAVSGFKLFWKALHILLESAPHGLTAEKVEETLTTEIPEIREVHHVHLWEVGSGEIHLTAHLVVEDRLLSEGLPVIGKASEVLREKLDVAHSTLQLETSSKIRLKGPA